MRRFTLTREAYIPSGATKVADKKSDAVAFLYTAAKGRPAAMGFHGRKARPDWNYVFPTEAAREQAVRAHFERHWQAEARKAERRAQASRPHGLEVGHILVSSWGWEQTNISYYQVTRLTGRCMIEVCAIASGDASSGREPWATGKSVPILNAFTGPVLRRRVNGARRAVRIDDVRMATVWDGTPRTWTAYA